MDSQLRTLLREYLQTRDPTTFLNLIANANRSGTASMHELELQLCRADLVLLEQILIQQFGPGRVTSRSEAAPPYRCGFTFQRLMQVYHQTGVIDWEISFGITYETLVGTPTLEQCVIIREKPLIVISSKYTPELVGMAYRITQKSFPHYNVEISASYPSRHEALNGCHTCGRFPKVMASDYCQFHDKFRKDLENRSKPKPSRNPASLDKYLTAQEFLEEMNYQDETGKHRAVQPHWQKVAEYAKATDPNRPFVLVRGLSLDALSLEHAPEDRELVSEYAGRSTDFPPIYVSLTDYQLAQDPSARPKVKNGNHRVVAAKRRGDTLIDAMMTQETWKNVQKSGFKRNPDEELRDAERKLRADDTFENRVNFLRMRLRVGQISADRVEAASEIGSPEAQAIYTPTGRRRRVVGMDWAIIILADHVPLKPLMEQVVLHALEGFTDNDAALRYIRNTFINLKYDLSTRMGPTDGRAERFLHATTEEIRNQLALQAQSPGTILTDWGIYDQARLLANAVRNVWSLSNLVIPEHQRARAADIACRILALCLRDQDRPGPHHEESEWQRLFIIEHLLRN